MKISEIKELIQLVNETEVNELELEDGDVRLFMRKGGFMGQAVQFQQIPMTTPAPIAQPATSAAPVSNPASTSTPQDVIASANVKGQPIKAPMVGTFYRSARPGTDPFIKVGDRVKKGQTICIIEAMKLMNEIEAEFSGKVVDILVEDGHPVEYGQTLCIIDPEK